MFEGVQYHVLDLVRKCNFGPLYLSSKWTKIPDLNYWKVDQNCNWTRDQNFRSEKESISVRIGNFGPLWNRSNLQFWSISKRNRVAQKWIFEPIPPHDTKLLQTLFGSNSRLRVLCPCLPGPLFRDIPNFSFSSLNCHFWGKITKMITRVNFWILTDPPYIWFLKFATKIAIIGMAVSRKSRKSYIGWIC